MRPKAKGWSEWFTEFFRVGSRCILDLLQVLPIRQSPKKDWLSECYVLDPPPNRKTRTEQDPRNELSWDIAEICKSARMTRFYKLFAEAGKRLLQIIYIVCFVAFNMLTVDSEVKFSSIFGWNSKVLPNSLTAGVQSINQEGGVGWGGVGSNNNFHVWFPQKKKEFDTFQEWQWPSLFTTAHWGVGTHVFDNHEPMYLTTMNPPRNRGETHRPSWGGMPGSLGLEVDTEAEDSEVRHSSVRFGDAYQGCTPSLTNFNLNVCMMLGRFDFHWY